MAAMTFQAARRKSHIRQGRSAAGAKAWFDGIKGFAGLRKNVWRIWDHLEWLLDKHLPVALPTTPSRIWWTLWLLAMVVYVSVDVPLHIAFENWREEPVVIWLGWISSATFCMDIAVNFRTAYVDRHGEVVRTPGLIATHYLRGMFLPDVLATVPLDDILDVLLHGNHHENAYWLGVLRLPRLYTVTRQLNYIVPVQYSSLMSVTKLLGVMILTAHWAACIWYYLSFEITSDWPWIFTVYCKTCPDLEKYIFAFYRSFLVMLGDRPTTYNNVERIFVIVLLFAGACMYAIVMGSMSLLVSSMWSMASRHKQRSAVLQDALRYNGASTDGNLRRRVDQYFDHMATYEHPGPEGVSMLSELPATLHAEVLASVFEPLLTRVQLFAFCERPFLWRLAQRLRLSMFMPKDTIYDIGSVGHEMFVIWRGVVVLSEPDGCMTALLTEGDHFGELGVMSASTPRPQRATAMCAVDAVLLSRADLLDAMRDFPESAHLVNTRAQVQLEDHEIGPSVWAASMATTHASSLDNDSSSYQILSSPRRTPDKPIKSIGPLRGGLKQQPHPKETAAVGGSGSSGGVGSTRRRLANGMTAGRAANDNVPRSDDQAASGRRLLAILLRQRHRPAVGGQAEASTAAATLASAAGAIRGGLVPAGPVAEATMGVRDTANDNEPHLGVLMSTDVTSFNPSTTDNPGRRLSASSDDSLCEVLLKASSEAKGCTAGPAPSSRFALPGYAPQTNRQDASGRHPPRPATAHPISQSRFQSPRGLPHARTSSGGGERPAGGEYAAAAAVLVPPRLPGRGSNNRQLEPGQAGHQPHRLSGCVRTDLLRGDAGGSQSQVDTGGLIQSGRNSSSTTSFLQAILPFRVVSNRPSGSSPTASNTHRSSTPPPLSPPLPPPQQQPQPQQQPTGSESFFGIDPKDLAALERVRFSSQRPADAGGVVRYLSKRARQQEANTANANTNGNAITSASANTNITASSNASPAVGAAWGKPSGEPGYRGAGGGASALEDRSGRGVLTAMPQFDLTEFEEINGSSTGQQRVPTASQMLFMPPQPFLGIDPLGPLFDPAPGQPLPQPASAFEAHWRARPGAQHATHASDVSPSYAPHELPLPYGGLAEDATTRPLVGPTGRRSMRAVLRGSGGRLSVASSLGALHLENSSSERLVEDWLSEHKPCCQGRCVQLEQQVAQLKRQLAATEARVESILEDPFNEPDVEAKAQRRLEEAKASLTKRMDGVLTQLLERVRGMSAGIGSLSLQVCLVDDRMQSLEDELQGGFGAVRTADLRLSATAAAVAAAVAAASAAPNGGVRVDTPVPAAEAAPASRNAFPAQLVGLLGPQVGAGGQQMGLLMPLSTAAHAATSGSLRSSAGPIQASFRQAPGSQSQGQGLANYLRRGSTVSMRAMQEVEVLCDATLSVGPSAPSDTTAGGASSAGGISSFQLPDQALLTATMNRAAGKNVRRRQSARDLSAIAAAAASQHQEQLPQPQSPALQLTTTSQPEAFQSSSLSRTNSRAEGARGRGRSSSIVGMAVQSAADGPSVPGLSPAASRRALRALLNAAPGVSPSESGGTEAVASPRGAAGTGTVPRVVPFAGGGDGQLGAEGRAAAGAIEITPAVSDVQGP